jgi:ETC complex I subunit conserved region
MVTARIYKPARTAMQSGKARTKEWFLEYEPEQPREIEPLMGWTASGDMRQQVRLRFDTAEEATAYCERHEAASTISSPASLAASSTCQVIRILGGRRAQGQSWASSSSHPH